MLTVSKVAQNSSTRSRGPDHTHATSWCRQYHGRTPSHLTFWVLSMPRVGLTSTYSIRWCHLSPRMAVTGCAVCLCDFVIFCHPTCHDTESMSVSNIYLVTDTTLTLNQLGIGRMTEALLKTEESTTSHCDLYNSNNLQVTLEVYSFDKERHSVWEVPCIRPLESDGSISVATKVSVQLLSSSVY